MKQLVSNTLVFINVRVTSEDKTWYLTFNIVSGVCTIMRIKGDISSPSLILKALIEWATEKGHASKINQVVIKLP